MRRYGVRPSVRPSDCTVSIPLSGGRLPLLSARSAVTLAILKRAATSFAWVITSRIYRVGQKRGHILKIIILSNVIDSCTFFVF